MEKGERIESVDAMNLLPEAMIHHIQSFLIPRDAARTAALSRSWRSAWLTRPHLDLDDRNFKPFTLFHEFALKTMQRYQDLNMTIDSFTLNANVDRELSTELVVKAMKLGATRLDLDSFIVLPKEVLDSETLIRLSLHRCGITSGKVNWGRLKSLRLHQVLANDDVINGIFSRCYRSLEELTISSCYRSFEEIICPLSFHAELSQLNLRLFNNLKFLSLEDTDIHPDLFNVDFSSRFPCLKDLSLRNCRINKNLIQITSPSVEHVIFAGATALTEVQFDFPRIRKVEYLGVGSTLQSSSLCNKGTFCGEWESHLWIRVDGVCGGYNSGKFLQTLKNFLWELRWSKICLYLTADSSFTFNEVKDNELQVVPHVAVENLTVDVPSSCRRAFFEGLYRVCTAARIDEP